MPLKRPAVRQITASQCQSLLDRQGCSSDNACRMVILDVRTEMEHRSGHLAGSINLNFRSSLFAIELAKLERSHAYLLYCRTGVRSARAAMLMVSLGFGQVYDLVGGIAAWLREGLPIVRDGGESDNQN